MSDTVYHLVGDHLALDRVRRQWSYESKLKFGRELQQIWLERFDRQPVSGDEPAKAIDAILIGMYLPGDYQQAELAVVRGGE